MSIRHPAWLYIGLPAAVFGIGVAVLIVGPVVGVVIPAVVDEVLRVLAG